jgi:hypothetical protein
MVRHAARILLRSAIGEEHQAWLVDQQAIGLS